MSLITAATEVATTVQADGLWSEIIDQASQAKDAVMAIAALGLAVISVVLFITAHGKIGKILGGLVSLGLGAWIIFGGGWSWLADKTGEQLNSAPVVVQIAPVDHGTLV